MFAHSFFIRHPFRWGGATVVLLAIGALFALPALPARADSDLEREKLARIDAEIRNVETMVEEARQSAQSQPSGSVQFRYDWLERDLKMVREGIEQHLDAPRQPRPVPPLRGDYRQ